MPYEVKKVMAFRVVQIPAMVLNGDDDLHEAVLNVKHKIISPKLLRELEEIRKKPEPIVVKVPADKEGESKPAEPTKMDMVKELAFILLDLDMVQNGKPVKPTEEFLDTMDFNFLRTVYGSIWESTFQKKAT